MRRIYQLVFLLLIGFPSLAQIRNPQTQATPSLKVNGLGLDYFAPKEYIIGGTTLTGAKYLDKDVIVVLSKLTQGETIMLPGEGTANAIKNLWAQGLFDDIKLNVSRIVGDTVYFDIEVVELPRLSGFEFEGISKSQKTDILEKLGDKAGKSIINDNLYNTTRSIITKYLYEKGFFYTTVDYKSKPDPNQENSVILQVLVNKGRRVKVQKNRVYWK